MKNVIVKVVMMTVAVVTLTACPGGGKKGNNAAPAPGAGQVCQIGPNGLCVGQVAYTGSGRWNGYLMVNPAQMPLYRQFLMENGLCHNQYQCNNPTQWVGVSIRLSGAQGRATITPYETYGWSRNRLSRPARVSSVNNGNSFNMVLIDNRQYIQAQIYPQPIVAPNNQIQLSSVFISAHGNVTSTTLIYRGVAIATGQLQGQRNVYGY